jgi:sugar-specific transcriptional regulator TrmB
MKTYASLLRLFGISEKWIIIYLALLQWGPMHRSELARVTNFHRVDLYRHIPLLIDVWLIHETIKGKRSIFVANSPERLKILLEDLQSDATSKIDHLVSVFDSQVSERPKIVYHEKNTGVTEVFRDIMDTQKHGDTLYRISSETDVASVNSYMPHNYRKVRSEKEIQMYLIMPEWTASEKKSRLDREMVTIPTGLSEFKENISMSIYNNKVAYMDYSTWSSIIIEHEQIATFQKQIFKLLFDSLKKNR